MSTLPEFTFPFSKSCVESFDAQPLNVYIAGVRANPAIILIVPYAVPVGMMANTIREWTKEFFVITWESRCCLTLDQIFEVTTRVDVDAQVEDMVHIMKHVGVSSAHVVGWCTGAIVALKASYHHPNLVESAVLTMGTYGFTEKDNIILSDYQIGINNFMPKVAADRRAAHVLHKLVFQNQAFMETMHNKWSHWTRIPFSDPESLFRFANSAIRILDEDVSSFVPKMMTPCLVLTSPGDRYAHPEHSRQVARLLPNCELFEDAEGDHYSIACPDSASVNKANSFIRTQSKRASGLQRSAVS